MNRTSAKAMCEGPAHLNEVRCRDPLSSSRHDRSTIVAQNMFNNFFSIRITKDNDILVKKLTITISKEKIAQLSGFCL